MTPSDPPKNRNHDSDRPPYLQFKYVSLQFPFPPGGIYRLTPSGESVTAKIPSLGLRHREPEPLTPQITPDAVISDPSSLDSSRWARL
jgi:hypothetical protein